MKQSIKQLAVSLVTLVVGLLSAAVPASASVLVDGLYYNLDEQTKTASVTYFDTYTLVFCKY